MNERYTELLERLRGVIDGPGEAAARLEAVCALLADNIEHYDWVGFYLVSPREPDTLILGPYVGEPTEHTRIAFGAGVCGRAALERATIEVPDVRAESNYLSCSLAVRAEIVLPLHHDGEFVGELDIDSHRPDPFTPDDRALLDALARLCGPPAAAAR